MQNKCYVFVRLVNIEVETYLKAALVCGEWSREPPGGCGGVGSRSTSERRGVRNKERTEPRSLPAAAEAAAAGVPPETPPRSRDLLRPSVRLRLRRSASDAGDSGDAIVSRDLNSEQKEDLRETGAPAPLGEGERRRGLPGAAAAPGVVPAGCAPPLPRASDAGGRAAVGVSLTSSSTS